MRERGRDNKREIEIKRESEREWGEMEREIYRGGEIYRESE